MALTAPASALSSQSEQPLGGRHDPAHLALRAHCRNSRRERLRGVVAGQALHPLTPPLSERGTDPVGGLPRPLLDLSAQHRHDHARQRRRGLFDRVAFGHGRRLGSGEHRPGGERLGQMAARLGGELDDVCSSSGPISSSSARVGELRSSSSSRFWSSPRARLTVRLSRAVTGTSRSSRRAMSSSSGPGAGFGLGRLGFGFGRLGFGRATRLAAAPASPSTGVVTTSASDVSAAGVPGGDAAGLGPGPDAREELVDRRRAPRARRPRRPRLAPGS